MCHALVGNNPVCEWNMIMQGHNNVCFNLGALNQRQMEA